LDCGKAHQELQLDKFRRKWITSLAPMFFVLRLKNHVEMINEGRQKWFRSMIRNLNYVVVLLQPDIANSLRKHSKVGPALEKKLKQLIEFVMHTKDKN
jgi:hypothetical protein